MKPLTPKQIAEEALHKGFDGDPGTADTATLREAIDLIRESYEMAAENVNVRTALLMANEALQTWLVRAVEHESRLAAQQILNKVTAGGYPD